MNMWQLASTTEQTTKAAASTLLGTADKNGDIWLNTGEVVMTVLTGVCIVFGMLVLLCLIIVLFGKIMDSSKNEDEQQETPMASFPKPEPIKSQPPAPAPAPEETDPSVVAAIMAAISCVLGKGNFRIRKITRTSTRSNWGANGASDNVKPF